MAFTKSAAVCGLLLLLGALGLAACAPDKPTEHPVVKMAPFDLDCPREQLAYTHIDDGVWGVTGCGRRVKYVKLCHQAGYGIAIHDECKWVQN